MILRSNNISKLSIIPELEHSKIYSKNLAPLYYNFAVKFYNFQMQYSLALLNSWSKAVEYVSNLKEPTGKTIQNGIRSTFDAELKDTLKKKEFSKSLSSFIDS